MTMQAAADITKGDPLVLCGPYEVRNDDKGVAGHIVGQAMADAKAGEAVTVRIRGVCVFDIDTDTTEYKERYHLSVFMQRGHLALCARDHDGGRVLKIDREKQQVHVLL